MPLPGTIAPVAREVGPLEQGRRAFQRQPLTDGWTDWFSVNAPVPGTTPVVWLAIDYNASEWKRTMENARALLNSGLAAVAVFITVAIMLAWRRALEDRRLDSLHDSQTASHAKTEFLSFLSHELRTPLQSILGRTELLSPTALSDGQRRHLTAIDTQSRHLLSLVTDLLDLGTIEAGNLPCETHRSPCAP